MNTIKELNKMGIYPIEEMDRRIKNIIVKDISEKISKYVMKFEECYNDIYIKLYNCPIYYAEIDIKFKGVFYYYKNNTIYIKKFENINEIYENLLRECIHYLQRFSKIDKNINRAGICHFKEFEIFGLGINEALVQYMTSNVMENKFNRNNNNTISIYTNSDKYYKYMTSLIYQIIFLLGEKEAIKSLLNSNELFEDYLYNTFEENTNKIIKNFDLMLNENNKNEVNEEKIINIYLETQEIIYKTYFTKMYKRVDTIKELDEQVDKLQKYEEIIGIELNNYEKESEFKKFKSDIEGKFLKKYVEINRNRNNNSLIVIYRNSLNKLWQRVVGFIERKLSKE